MNKKDNKIKKSVDSKKIDKSLQMKMFEELVSNGLPELENRDTAFKPNGKMRLNFYEEELTKLQIELIKLQNWVRRKNKRVLIIFEGRDTAGKGGVIKRLTEHLNPRGSRIVALLKPSDTEQKQWYFQRYVKHLPDPGEIVFFDRSWYNRAGVERVMGFCNDNQYHKFMRQCPMFEQMLVDDGIILFKYYLSISKEEQKRRLDSRKIDPLKMWKLSPLDKKAIDLFEDYTKAKDEMFAGTHSPYSPWIVVNANDKKRARINIIRDILAQIPYKGKENPVAKLVKDSSIVNIYSQLLKV